MAIEIAKLVSSVTTLNSLAKAMLGLHDAAQLNPKVIEFQQAMIEANTRVLSVQQEYLSMTTDVQKLKDENVRLKDWSAEKEKYALREIASGVFAQIEKDFVGNLQSAQKLCCNCFEQGIKSLLQQSSLGSIVLTCPRCKTQLLFFCYKGGIEPEEPSPRIGTGDQM
jgi:hypothetical protein